MRFEDWKAPDLEHGKLTKWNWMVYHPHLLTLGMNVDIGAFTYLNAEYGITLEDDVQIGSHCSLYSVSTIDNKQGPIMIQKNARIGSHSTILPGVTVGENSIIGAHSLVNKDIPTNVVAYGVPAKIIRALPSPTKDDQQWYVTGDPVGSTIPLFKTYTDQDDIDAVAAVLRRGTYWACGPEIEEFENRIATYVGTRYAAAFNSGTSALHTLLLASGIGLGDEVIVPSFTFIATANTVMLSGATPVFAESEEDTFGLDARDVERKITSKTKAIIPLHYGGAASRDIKKLREIADTHHLRLIDDAAESLGASVDGKKVGTFGHAAIFSFCQNKVLATGEGGMIVTDDKNIYEKAKLLRSHGRVEGQQDYFSATEDNDYIDAGYNYRMPTVIAALGLAQLKKINTMISLRREHAQTLSKELVAIPQVRVPQEQLGQHQVYQMFTIMLPEREMRDRLQDHLTKNGIMNKIYFNPIHLKTAYRNKFGYKEGDLPATEQLSGRVLTIPLYPGMTKEDIHHISIVIKKFFN